MVLDTATSSHRFARTGTRCSRTEVAAQLFGDAHALDTSTRLATLVTRALITRDGPADERSAWERAGVPLDLVSAPVLSWALPVLGAGGVAAVVRSLTAAGLPTQLSVLALRASPLTVAPGSPVLVVENPRLLEAATERHLVAAVLCTNGNPTTAPSLAIAQLRHAGCGRGTTAISMRPAWELANRARDAGCEPFLMTASDYVGALNEASAAGVELPRDPAAAPHTPWVPALAIAFNEHRAIVHEERGMDDVLAADAADR